MMRYTLSWKIQAQMNRRGWTVREIEHILNQPDSTSNTRFDGTSLVDKSTGDGVTAYIDRDGHYVVRNDRTGAIIQISDRTDPYWKPEYKR